METAPTPTEDDTEPAYLYDAFISYSHALDGRLAPALQRALHRFAKPWYRLRALHVFRDETSLAASPSLWPSIEHALDRSRFFILLASPAAADSEWVAREVSHWLAHRSQSRVLVVVTHGEVAWSDADSVDRERTTALPPALADALTEEPRYVDLRWARDEAQLSPNEPRFRAAVADLAATIHGRPKEDLLGEDIRQQRRAVRLARAAGITLAALAIAAVAAALVALDARDTARAQRDVAETQARLATSRALAARAAAVRAGQHDLATLLALESYDADATYEARNELVSSLERSARASGMLRIKRGSAPLGLAFSPDGHTLASGGLDGGIRLWNVPTRKPIGSPLASGTKFVHTLVFSPDGGTLAVAKTNGLVSLWNVAEEREVGAALRMFPEIQLDEAVALVYSRDGRWLTGVDFYARVATWDVERREPARAPVDLGDMSVGPAALSPDARRLVTVVDDGTTRFVDTDPARSARQSTLAVKQPSAFAFSPDGRRLAVGNADRTITIWDVERQHRLADVLRGHEDEVTGLAFSPDGSTLASGSRDGTIRFWDLGSSEPLASALPGRGFTSVVGFSADRRSVALAQRVALGRYEIAFWELARRTPPADSFKLPVSFPSFEVLSPDGATLAVGDSSGAVQLWDLVRRKRLARLPGSRDDRPFEAAFSPDGHTLATVSGFGVLRFWDVPQRRLRGRPLKAEAGDMAFSADGTQLATASYRGIVLWDVATRSKVAVLPEQGAAEVAFAPAGGTVAVGTQTGAVRFWDVRAHTPIGERVATGSVAGLAFSPDGRTLVTTAEDGRMTLWDVTRRRPLGEPVRAAVVPAGENFTLTDVAFSPDGSVLITADDRGLFWDSALWSTDAATWHARLCPIVGRNLTPVEWSDELPDETPRPTCPLAVAGGAGLAAGLHPQRGGSRSSGGTGRLRSTARTLPSTAG